METLVTVCAAQGASGHALTWCLVGGGKRRGAPLGADAQLVASGSRRRAACCMRWRRPGAAVAHLHLCRPREERNLPKHAPVLHRPGAPPAHADVAIPQHHLAQPPGAGALPPSTSGALRRGGHHLARHHHEQLVHKVALRQDLHLRQVQLHASPRKERVQEALLGAGKEVDGAQRGQVELAQHAAADGGGVRAEHLLVGALGVVKVQLQVAQHRLAQVLQQGKREGGGL